MKSTIAEIRNRINEDKARSAWERGIRAYAEDLLVELEETIAYYGRDPETAVELQQWLLNGASDWSQYSWGGCALIFDDDIAERLSAPRQSSRRPRGGKRRPIAREEWLDAQARALQQASLRICAYAF